MSLLACSFDSMAWLGARWASKRLVRLMEMRGGVVSHQLEVEAICSL